MSHFFLYCNVAFFFTDVMWVRVFDEVVTSVPYSRRKKQVKCRAWGEESVCISVIARVHNSESLFQSFLYALRRGAVSCPHQRDVRNREVQKRRESTVISIGFCLLHALTSSRVTSKCILGFQATDLRPITVVFYDWMQEPIVQLVVTIIVIIIIIIIIIKLFSPLIGLFRDNDTKNVKET